MLQQIFIQNYALIEHLELELHPGATMLTGETGAGKSIILGAIDLALGQRAKDDVIKPGADRAEIILSFDIAEQPKALAWLEAQDLSDDHQCIVRRIMTSAGKSKCYINSRPCNVSQLRALGQFLVNMHGQHQNHSLLKKETQTDIVDALAKNQTLLAEIKDCFHAWKERSEELSTLEQKISESKQRTEFIQFQLAEFEKLDLTQEEIKQLPEQHKRLAHAEELAELYQQATQQLSESDGNIVKQFSELLNTVQAIQKHDAGIQESAELLNSALIQLEEAQHNITAATQSLEINPQELATLETKMQLIHSLANKHHVLPENLLELYQNLQDELASLENIDEDIETLKRELNERHQQYQSLAKKLTTKRKGQLSKLNKAVTKHLHNLGMPQAQFSACLEPLNSDQPHPRGHETVSFMICTNPGNPTKPMSQIASGGELSRISLAIQVICANHIALPTLFFDEVDVGIGGTTAAIVGQLLRELSQSHQVICITHQPQVAASGHQHLHVIKHTDGKQTQVEMVNLTEEARIEEVARMLGGLKVTKQTKVHAKEMLEMHQS